jgi:hypothetical protein
MPAGPVDKQGAVQNFAVQILQFVFMLTVPLFGEHRREPSQSMGALDWNCYTS